MANAESRFQALMEALTPPSNLGRFRTSMMKAYGLDHQVVLDVDETMEAEKEFANKCLNGEGPTQQELTARGDLRAVLLKEIGLIPEDDIVDENTGESVSIEATPWLKGDWVKMAKLIVHFVELEENNKTDDELRSPLDMVRLCPIDTNEGVGGWAKESYFVEEEGTSRYQCFIKTYSGKKWGSKGIYLQADSAKHKSYTWLILPEGPNQITSTRDKGISRNLWTGLRYPPGTSQVSDPSD